VLRGAGFEVLLAPDDRLALEDFENTRPIDLLITDIVMSQHVNGVALSRMARMRRPRLKIIYITAYDIRGIEDEAIAPGPAQADRRRAARRRGQARSCHRLTPERGSFRCFFVVRPIEIR